MPRFMLAYHGGAQPKTPEEGAAHMERYKKWLADLGDAALEPANTLRGLQTVTADGVNDGGVDNQMMGYTVIEADDMAAAITIAKACPFVEMDTAKLVVAEIGSM
ncbi:YciI family protein [Falsihalocynthiibacter sp. SS001]|uniref:YciI family protein n=1 Tax=Falsihalocynthiibacter sp. SS001 TaxID=3349698 RepID=UPI0036D37F12